MGGTVVRETQGWGEERGSALALLAVTLAATLTMGALVVDGGRAFVTRCQLQNVADAAALAAVSYLPEDPAGADRVARELVELNAVGPVSLWVEISEDRHRISLGLETSLPMTLAAGLGIATARVTVGARAEVGAVSGLRGAQPFGILEADFTFGELYTIKTGAGDGSQGNFGAIALGGTGAQVYEQNIRSGYQGWLRLGDVIPSEPGNMSGPTRRGLSYRLAADPGATFDCFRPGSPRLLYLPLLEPIQRPGRCDMKIVGFAAFFLEGVNGDRVLGRFLRYVTYDSVELGGPDYGLRGARLVRWKEDVQR